MRRLLAALAALTVLALMPQSATAYEYCELHAETWIRLPGGGLYDLDSEFVVEVCVEVSTKSRSVARIEAAYVAVQLNPGRLELIEGDQRRVHLIPADVPFCTPYLVGASTLGASPMQAIGSFMAYCEADDEGNPGSHATAYVPSLTTVVVQEPTCR